MGASGQKFKDPVTFGVTSRGRSLTSFKFGEPSCEGSGGPPPTKNPYTSSGETANMGTVAVKAFQGGHRGPAHMTFKAAPK